MAKKLATIVRDVPITFHLEDCDTWDVDSAAAIKLFEKLGFKTLTARTVKVGKEIDKEKQMTLV